jgi:hypothetical protein
LGSRYPNGAHTFSELILDAIETVIQSPFEIGPR